jgi:transcription elongation regulator 1
MAPSVAAAALQPPVPGQYFGNRPSFSYNVVSHANAGLPTGQQFQLDTVIPHVFIASINIEHFYLSILLNDLNPLL